jgi:hypothetical protein
VRRVHHRDRKWATTVSLYRSRGIVAVLERNGVSVSGNFGNIRGGATNNRCEEPFRRHFEEGTWPQLRAEQFDPHDQHGECELFEEPCRKRQVGRRVSRALGPRRFVSFAMAATAHSKRRALVSPSCAKAHFLRRVNYLARLRRLDSELGIRAADSQISPLAEG